MSYGFSTQHPTSLQSDFNKTAQNVWIKSWYFNAWRRATRKTIASLNQNKNFGIAFAWKMATIEPSISLDKDNLRQIEKVQVRWQDETNPLIHINVYNHTEQALYDHLTRL